MPLNPSFAAVSAALAGIAAGCASRTASPASDDAVEASGQLLIPAGSFVAGAECNAARVEPGCDRSYRDGRTVVTLDAFSIDRDLIRSGEYAACVRAGACPGLSQTADRRAALGFVFAGFESARAYCEWRGGALPTPDQFERIARGTEGALSVALIPQWTEERDGRRPKGVIRGGSERAYEADPPRRDAAFRCARPVARRKED
ncbi:MAG TPA: SUMF1/EgtB/PvdO family nonheme iron enzyme [bacterium]|nr:SUMF1/EgtB/PvdO family nonheme iron enzyme [bacterium]